jgi:ABC-2 type transport system permease protein
MKKVKYYYNLIKELSWADFKLKYYGSVLGMFWSFLKPFLMLLILYMVFNSFLKSGINNFHIFLLLGITIWNFFQDGTKASIQSITSKKNILQKINLSPVATIASTILHSFWTFMITLVVFFIMFFSFGLKLSLSAILLPYFIILLVILIFGTSLIISPIHMKFRDFTHIWDVFLQMLFWATPIVYGQESIPASFNKYYLLNPLSRIIIDCRNIIIKGFFPDFKQVLITTVIVLLIFILGITIFKKYGKKFIEEL